MAKKGNELAGNRQAYYNYEILETCEAGIVLQGTEVKSLREGGGNLRDAFINISGQTAWLEEASIAPYRFGNIHNHEEKRKRKLLLHKKEISTLKKESSVKGYTIIPLSIYLKKGLIKISIAVAKGKKMHDKRGAIKEKEQKRAIAKALKESS